MHLIEELNVNDITKVCDEYLMAVEKKAYETLGWHNYLAHFDNGVYLIRYPGATRGRVETNEDNIITNVEIYDSEIGVCYKTGVNDALKKFIGTRFVLN